MKRLLIICALVVLGLCNASVAGSVQSCNPHSTKCQPPQGEPSMGRLVTSGFEWRDATTTTTAAPDGKRSGVTLAYDTGTVRSGSQSLKWDASVGALASNQWAFTAAASGTSVYVRTYIYVPSASSLVGNQSVILALGPGASSFAAVTLETNGTLQLWAFIGGVTWTQQGSASSAISYDSWQMVDLRFQIGAGSVDQTEARLEGVSFASTSGLNVTDTQISSAFVGGLSSLNGGGTATSGVVYFDDVGVNDGSGASQNSWPGSEKVVLLKAISLNANGGSWTDSAAATTSAALTDAVDNTPPTGIADTTATAGRQDRNAAANTSLDMNLTTYTTAGIGSADTINVLQPWCNTGAPVVTAAKTGSLGITTNPTIANTAFLNGGTAAANFWSGVTAGSYPTGWKWEKGTTTYGSSVTVGSSPVARVTITGGTTTRIAMVDAIGMYVGYTPAPTKSPPFQARTARNMLLRR